MLTNMNPQQKPTKFLAIGMGVVISILLAGGGYFMLNSASRADDSLPRDTVVSEITQNSAKVAWTTGVETQGVVEYGTSPTSLNFFAPESEKTQDHTVDLTLLSPSTTYYFHVRIADKQYDNAGVPWTFTTKSAESGNANTSDPTPTSAPSFTTSPTCNESDCEKIKDKFFSGCDTQDYIKCIKAKETGQ